MKRKPLRVAFTVLWAAVCIALILFLAGGVFSFGPIHFTSGVFSMNRGTILGAELIYQESSAMQGVERLDVTAYSESVRVFAVDGGEFAIRQYGPADTLKEELVQISRDGSALRVTIPSRINFRFIGIGIINNRLEIDVPREWFGDAKISTSSGTLTLEHGFSWRSASLGASSGTVRLTGPLTLEGDAGVTTSSGSVRLQDLTAASARLKTSSGTLSVDGKLILTGDLDASTSSGALRLSGEVQAARMQVSTSSGTLTLGDVRADSVRGKTSSGRIRITKLESASFDLETSSGGIQADALTGGGRLKSSSGSINMGTLRPTGNVDARASSGGVKLHIPTDLAFTFNAHCSAGSIKSNDYSLYYQGKNNKTATYTHREGGPVVSVETTSGSIGLNR